MPKWSLNRRASSPIVIPCRIGIGYRPTNDSKPWTSIGPSTSTPPIGIRPVADDDLDAVLAARSQAIRHRVDVGVDAGADVLQVDDEHVEVVQHRRRRLARLAVERVDGHAPELVARVRRFDHVLLDVGSESVLRAEDRRQAAPSCRRQLVGDVDEAGDRPTPGCRRRRRAGRGASPPASSRSEPSCTRMRRLFHRDFGARARHRRRLRRTGTDNQSPGRAGPPRVVGPPLACLRAH